MIGDHSVVFIPDPDVQAWGPDLASNPEFTTDLAGWGPAPFGDTWTWSAGWAITAWKPKPPPENPYRNWRITRLPSAPIPRDPAATLYRIRTRIEVSGACWVLHELMFGTTPTTAHGGPFWYPAEADIRGIWIWVPSPQTITVESTIDPSTVNPAFVYLAPHIVIAPDANDFPTAPRIDSIHLQGQGGDALDITCVVDEVSINHGREDSNSQPDAASATLSLSSWASWPEPIPDALEIGGFIRVNTRTPTTDSIRFLGRITDLSYTWEEAGEQTPDRVAGTVIAVATLADLGRRVVGDVPFPQELDGARVARVLSLAGVSLDPTFSDPGTVQILARDIDSRAALEVAHETASSAGGMVWHTRSGEVRYADADHRRGATSSLDLDACNILVAPQWRRTIEGLVNGVSIGYGVVPEGGEQPRYVADKPVSVDRYGSYEISVETELAALADASRMGQLLLTRNSSPVWVMSELPIDLKGLTAEETAAVLAFDVGSLLNLTGLPAAGGAPTTATLWVEGWDETLGFGIHEITLTVSGYCRTAPPPRWDDVDESWTWNSVPDLAWDDLACLGPPDSGDTWADVPASTRWNLLPPALTWDNYAPS